MNGLHCPHLYCSTGPNLPTCPQASAYLPCKSPLSSLKVNTLPGRPQAGQLCILYSTLLLLFSCQVMSTLCDPTDCSMPRFPILHHLPEFVQTNGHWILDAIQPSHPVAPFSSCPQSSPVLGSLPVSWLFTSGGPSIGTSVSASVSDFPMNIQGLISFRIDWFDLLAVQGTLKSLLQHYNLKASVLWHSAFFMVQHSHCLLHDYRKNHSFDYEKWCLWFLNTWP